MIEVNQHTHSLNKIQDFLLHEQPEHDLKCPRVLDNTGRCFVTKEALCMLSRFSHVLSFATLYTVSHQAPLCPWDSPGKITGVDFHALFQKIFLIQESNLHLSCLLNWHMCSYHQCHLGSLVLCSVLVRLQTLTSVFLEDLSRNCLNSLSAP